MFGIGMEYFVDTFPQEMAAKIANIPDEYLVTPPASIAVPTLQGLSYTFEEPDLKELYLNLLATASDDRRADQAHPAFADIIKQLTANEAKLLSETLRTNAAVIARLKDERSDPPGSVVLLMSHLLPLLDATGKPREEPQAPVWVDNWQRLGLVNVSYDQYLPGDGRYDWVQERPEYAQVADRPDVTSLTFDKGTIIATYFGRQFFQAVTE